MHTHINSPGYCPGRVRSSATGVGTCFECFPLSPQGAFGPDDGPAKSGCGRLGCPFWSPDAASKRDSRTFCVFNTRDPKKVSKTLFHYRTQYNLRSHCLNSIYYRGLALAKSGVRERQTLRLI